MDQMNQNMGMGKGCSCPHHKVVPFGIVLIGLSALLTTLGMVSAGTNAVVWPVLLILIGLTKAFGKGCKCCTMKHM